MKGFLATFALVGALSYFASATPSHSMPQGIELGTIGDSYYVLFNGQLSMTMADAKGRCASLDPGNSSVANVSRGTLDFLANATSQHESSSIYINSWDGEVSECLTLTNIAVTVKDCDTVRPVLCQVKNVL